MQIVTNWCDNPGCNHQLKGYRVRVSHEFSSRSMYGREYCSTECAVEDAYDFEQEARRRDRSA